MPNGMLPDNRLTDQWYGWNVAVGGVGSKGATAAIIDHYSFTRPILYVYDQINHNDYDPTNDTWLLRNPLQAPMPPIQYEPGVSSMFGYALDIAGDTIVVANPSENLRDTAHEGCLEPLDGAAYIYHRLEDGSWANIDRLEPPEYPDCYEWEPPFPYIYGRVQFAIDVATDGDNVAVVGTLYQQLASHSEEVWYHGYKAYVFDRFGVLQDFLEPFADVPTPHENVNVGFYDYQQYDRRSVALSDGVLAFGVPFDLETDLWTGSVYVSRQPAWGMVEQVLSDQSFTETWFGFSVALDGNWMLVGAPFDNEAAAGAGAVFSFYYNGTQWVQTQKIAPPSGLANEYLGWHIKMSGDTALLDCWASSKLHVYRRVPHNAPSYDQWVLENSLPMTATTEWTSGAEGWWDVFQRSGESQNPDNVILIGDWLDDDDIVTDAGKVDVYQPCKDTDADGLCDSWEEAQAIPTEMDGVFCDLPGANPLRKDLYIEIDRMPGIDFDAGMLDEAQAAFANAPVKNPDDFHPTVPPQDDGINLHIVFDDDTIPYESSYHNDFEQRFHQDKQAWFGTSDERIDDPPGRAEAIRTAKLKAYRYCILVDEFEPDSTYGDSVCGRAERPGDDMVLAMGAIKGELVYVHWRDVSRIFMHELGHNLGLGHGGDDAINYKPNYVSVMNYGFGRLEYFRDDPSTPENELLENVRLDYSREGSAGGMITLDEMWLDETAGLHSSTYANVLTFFGAPDETNPNARKIVRVPLDTPSVDWDWDGVWIETETWADLNWLGSDYPGPEAQPSPDQELPPNDDWYDIKENLPIRGDGDFRSGISNTIGGLEISEEIIAWLDENVPMYRNYAPADFNKDIKVDADDFDVFLMTFGYSDGDSKYNASADYDSDSTVTFVDYQAWLGYYRAYLQNQQAPAPTQALGDFNTDADVDLADFGYFQRCFTGPNGEMYEGCADADLDHDGDVDMSDFGYFQRCVSGPGQPLDIGCKY